ncbi:MAG: SufD family Fe-S cluster assembly protein [Candidatus Komeilibacteria bacterium]
MTTKIERTSKKITKTKKITVPAGEVWEYILIQDAAADLDLKREFIIKKDASLKVITILLNGQKVNWQQECYLEDFGASAEQYILVIQDDDREVNLLANAVHTVGQTKSKIIVRKVLDDKAQNDFKGLIKITKGAQGSVGRLNDQSLLLSPDVRNHCIPGLDIEADNVQASHSSSQSQLNPDDLLYFQSRGLSPKQATGILIDGFAASVYDMVSDRAVKDELRQLIQQKIYAL